MYVSILSTIVPLSSPGDVGIGDAVGDREIECDIDRWRCIAGKSAISSGAGQKWHD